MSLQYVRLEFVSCAACAAKPGSPVLCHECLERRELYGLAERARHNRGVPKEVRDEARICWRCSGNPNPDCPEHGR